MTEQEYRSFLKERIDQASSPDYLAAYTITLDRFNKIEPEGYDLVMWPDSQDYMDEDWFEEEAIFCGGSEGKTGSSAYFIPRKYL